MDGPNERRLSAAAPVFFYRVLRELVGGVSSCRISRVAYSTVSRAANLVVCLDGKASPGTPSCRSFVHLVRGISEGCPAGVMVTETEGEEDEDED